MSDELKLQEAERVYYNLNRLIRNYDSNLPPSIDREWQALLNRHRRAKDICNEICHQLGRNPK